MTVTRMIARPMIASMFVVGGVNALRNADVHAQRAKKVTDRLAPTLDRISGSVPVPTDPKSLVRLNSAAQLVGAAGLATGRMPRASAALLAASLVPTTAAGHLFWEEHDPATRQQQKVHFFKNVSMLGGLLLAAVDTDGKPGVAWRAKHAATDARRSARQMRKQAKLQGRLAAKSVG
ncbi:MAG TPA: DoxX family protein [Marmoricola sp.]|nr:DoxX family protein [Marmoricola sp.]